MIVTETPKKKNHIKKFQHLHNDQPQQNQKKNMLLYIQTQKKKKKISNIA
jgi:hypothetical protein